MITQRQGHPWEQAQTRDFCQSRPEPVTFARAGPCQWPLQDQDQASNLCGSRPKQVTSMVERPTDLQDFRASSRSTEWLLWVLRNHWECWVTSGVTGTVAPNPPWGVTIWAMDPVALGRLIIRDTVLTTPIRGKDGKMR